MRGRLLLTAAIGTVGCLSGTGGLSRRPCVEWPEAARPLLVGDSMRLRVRGVVVSDCDGPISDRARWTSDNPAIATIDTNGLVFGVAPGRFRARAMVGGDSLSTDGFVLPVGWRARILPESVIVRVGDTVRFEVAAFDSTARMLPTVPFTVITPELQRDFDEMKPASEPPPFTDKASYQNVTTPGAFLAKRPGTTSMIGIIGGQRVKATLVILPAGLDDGRQWLDARALPAPTAPPLLRAAAANARNQAAVSESLLRSIVQSQPASDSARRAHELLSRIYLRSGQYGRLVANLGGRG